MVRAGEAKNDVPDARLESWIGAVPVGRKWAAQYSIANRSGTGTGILAYVRDGRGQRRLYATEAEATAAAGLALCHAQNHNGKRVLAHGKIARFVHRGKHRVAKRVQ